MSGRLEIIESPRDFDRAIKEIENCGPWISFDSETSGLNPFAEDAYLASIGIGTLTKDFTFPLNHYLSRHYKDGITQSKWMKGIGKAIADKKKAAHNGKFDTLFINQVFGLWWHTDFDTMLAHYNLDENSLHGLKDLAMRFFGDDGYDIPMKEKQGIEGSLEKHCEYLGYDVYYTFRLRRKLMTMFEKEPDAYKLFMNLTMPLSHLYTKVETRGVYIDPTKLIEGEKYWKEIADSTDKELRGYLKGFSITDKKGKPQEINFGSPQQLCKFLYDHLKLPILDKTPSGKPSTSESVLKRMSHPIGKTILDNREANKNLGTFVKSWQSRKDHNNRIHPSFKIHGTVTGRPSCVEPNLQQVPRDSRIRSIICAPKGWELIEADYSQAELRIAANLSRDPRLLEAYNTGLDVHTITVQEIFGIMNPTKEERKKGKAINFGFLYGMWWKKFMIYARDNYGVTFTEKESENIRKKFFKTYSGLPDWHLRQKKVANRQGYVMNMIGRKRRLPDAMIPDRGQYDPKKSEAERQAINSPVQSLASDINVLSAIEIDRKIDNSYCQVIGTVHDSILVLVRKDKLDYCAKKIKHIMENCEVLRDVFKCKLSVPIVAEVSVGPWSLGKPYE